MFATVGARGDERAERDSVRLDPLAPHVGVDVQRLLGAPSFSHALRSALYVIVFASTRAARICANISSALSTWRPFSHALMTAPNVMPSGSTPAAWHSSKISRARSSWRPLAHALIRAL